MFGAGKIRYEIGTQILDGVAKPTAVGDRFPEAENIVLNISSSVHGCTPRMLFGRSSFAARGLKTFRATGGSMPAA